MHLISTAVWDNALCCFLSERLRVFQDTSIMHSVGTWKGKFKRFLFFCCFDCYFLCTLIILLLCLCPSLGVWIKQMYAHRSVWSLLIIPSHPHGRQMALLIFQTDTAFWYLIWWLLCVCVCECVSVWFPGMNSINLSSEVPCWLEFMYG